MRAENGKEKSFGNRDVVILAGNRRYKYLFVFIRLFLEMGLFIFPNNRVIENAPVCFFTNANRRFIFF